MSMNKKERLLGWLLLVVVTIFYFFANLQKVVVPGAVFNELQAIFNTDAGSITRLGAAFLWVYAFCQLIVGVIADRFGGARAIAFGGAFFCTGALFSSFDTSYSLLFFSRVLTGLGASFVYLSMIKLIKRIAGSSFAMMVGIAILIGYSGGVTGNAPFIFGVQRFGYRTMMLWAGAATAVIYLLFLLVSSVTPKQAIDRNVKLAPKTYWTALRLPQNMRLMLTTGFCFGSYFNIQSIIGKKFLEDYCLMSTRSAGWVLTAMMVIGSCNGLLMAALSRALGNRRKVILAGGACGTLLSALILFVSLLLDFRNGIGVSAALILIAFAGNFSPISSALYSESNHESRFGTALCISNCFAYLVVALSGTLFGKLMDLFPPQMIDGIKIYGRNSYLAAFSLLLLFTLIPVIASFGLKESRGNNIANQCDPQN